MCVYILFRKFLSLFRHFQRIGCWQDVGCEVLQAVRVGTVKNLSSQYICTHVFRKFLSLFRHFLRIGCWQDVCCEVLQAVRVGTVKNLSSQYIYTPMLCRVFSAPECRFWQSQICRIQLWRVRFKAEKWHVCIIPSRN